MFGKHFHDFCSFNKFAIIPETLVLVHFFLHISNHFYSGNKVSFNQQVINYESLARSTTILFTEHLFVVVQLVMYVCINDWFLASRENPLINPHVYLYKCIKLIFVIKRALFIYLPSFSPWFVELRDQ